jgi:hypothetical protein
MTTNDNGVRHNRQRPTIRFVKEAIEEFFNFFQNGLIEGRVGGWKLVGVGAG